MSSKEHCTYCNRLIDVTARACPFCNRLAPVPSAQPPLGVDSAPSPIAGSPQNPEAAPRAGARPSPVARGTRGGNEWTPKLLVAAAIAALMVATFAIGGLVYGLGSRDDKSKKKARVIDLAESPANNLPDLPFVPESEFSSTATLPVTTTPLPDSGQQLQVDPAADATAMPAEQYSKVLAAAEAERQRQFEAADPRRIPGNVYRGGGVLRSVPTRPPPNRPPPLTSRPPDRSLSDEDPREQGPRRETRRTAPVPRSQPISVPQRDVRRSGTVRLDLTIDPDGSVREIGIVDSIPGIMPKVLSSVQRWRFDPATENGVPVTGRFQAEIRFNADNDD